MIYFRQPLCIFSFSGNCPSEVTVNSTTDNMLVCVITLSLLLASLPLASCNLFCTEEIYMGRLNGV